MANTGGGIIYVTPSRPPQPTPALAEAKKTRAPRKFKTAASTAERAQSGPPRRPPRALVAAARLSAQCTQQIRPLSRGMASLLATPTTTNPLNRIHRASPLGLHPLHIFCLFPLQAHPKNGIATPSDSIISSQRRQLLCNVIKLSKKLKKGYDYSTLYWTRSWVSWPLTLTPSSAQTNFANHSPDHESRSFARLCSASSHYSLGIC